MWQQLFYILYLKFKYQLLDAYSITIIWFNITKYDYMIFQDCDCSHKNIWNGINNKYKSIL